ncbi:DUF2147 domain-containing protein [Henriciella barbarensis]|uniref:DUF2147 domain-containing protein n=1 Tax=Henriciella barbarensis TaxID=86342 RepID=A0A399R1C9_9PROT|nr:DUF2147 domain-containing protein [Henriciella barbarensis]RIJ24045.1 DUF2147 domain-containing protein [Henriciella barbarensis]
MKTALVCIAFAAAGATASAQGIVGVWNTGTNGAEVEIAPCGAEMCGTLLTSNAIKESPEAKDVENKDRSLRDRPLKGVTMLTGFSGGPERWSGGKLYNPADGKTYSGTMTLISANTLELQGCVIRPLCRTSTWTRIR